MGDESATARRNPAHAGAPAARPTARRLPEEAWLAVAGPGLIFLGHLVYGAMLPQTALSLTALAAILVAACLSRARLRRELSKVRGLAVPAALYGAVILVALWSLTPFVIGGAHPVWAYLKISPGAATIDRSATLFETIKLTGLACVFVLGLATGASDNRARLAVNVFLAAAAAYGAWSFLSFLAWRQPGGARLESSLLSANAAATFFAGCFVLAFGPLVSRLNGPRPQRLTGLSLFGAAAFLFLVCLFATASRGGFVAAITGLIVLALMLVFGGRLKWSKALLTGLGGAVVLSLLLLVAGDLLLDRLGGGTKEFASRAFILQVHWQAFLASPLYGYGLGSFDTVNRMLLDAASFPRIWTVRAAHNVYLAWLEEGGLLAALPMFGCIGAVILATGRSAMRRTRMTSLLFALLALDAVVLVHGATDFALELFSMAATWAYLLGLQFALSQGSSAR
jgi:O-antigen ligase